MISIKDDRAGRTIRITMTGFIKLDEMQTSSMTLRKLTDAYRGTEHLVLADMRGLKPAAPEAAEVLGATIAYVRQRGVVHCAHISDSSTVALQAARLVREAVAGDPGMTNAVSLEEAELVLDEARRKLAPPK